MAGPMRGHEMLNFPKFAEVTEKLRDQDWVVISPAEMDLDAGYDPSSEPSDDELVEMFERDLAAIDTVDTIVLLPGWRTSEGVAVELRHASKRKPAKPDLREWDDVAELPKPIEWAAATMVGVS